LRAKDCSTYCAFAADERQEMETIDTIFVGGPFSRAYRVTFTDGQVFILDEVFRGKDQGEPPHIVANA